MSVFDENREILRRLADQGTDLGKPLLVDFEHVFPDLASARAFCAGIVDKAEIQIQRRDGDDQWDARVSMTMLPSCEDITRIEIALAERAGEFGGYADGWGFLSPPPATH
jgi:hypothetical protein